MVTDSGRRQVVVRACAFQHQHASLTASRSGPNRPLKFKEGRCVKSHLAAETFITKCHSCGPSCVRARLVLQSSLIEPDLTVQRRIWRLFRPISHALRSPGDTHHYPSAPPRNQGIALVGLYHPHIDFWSHAVRKVSGRGSKCSPVIVAYPRWVCSFRQSWRPRAEEGRVPRSQMASRPPALRLLHRQSGSRLPWRGSHSASA